MSTMIPPEIRPTHLTFSGADLDDLRARLAQVRWPAPQPGDGWHDGVPGTHLRRLVDEWRLRFDWRGFEARLDAWPQGLTVIDGQRIHFIQVRSEESDALPLLLTHGWPSSIAEHLDLVGPLTDPRSHGADPSDAFHLVIPSVPGVGLSGPTADSGWTAPRIAAAWAELMGRLHCDRYGVHGGGMGAVVSREVGRLDGEHVAGVHLTSAASAFTPAFDPDPAPGQIRLATRAYGLTDSPVAQLAWMLERFREWTELGGQLPEEALGRDFLLANATLYWLTRTAGSAERVEREVTSSTAGLGRASRAPTGVAVFPFDHPRTDRRAAERANAIVHWSRFDRGGRFPALEVPDLLVGDIRTFFRGLR